MDDTTIEDNANEIYDDDTIINTDYITIDAYASSDYGSDANYIRYNVWNNMNDLANHINYQGLEIYNYITYSEAPLTADQYGKVMSFLDEIS